MRIAYLRVARFMLTVIFELSRYQRMNLSLKTSFGVVRPCSYPDAISAAMTLIV